ncbi:hypothetical protein [Haliscomenobacter hydrossis]|uniref:PKD domain containing protein n=1 Tax=Haliscomenobacter hydrossis (strain ATCC 27775 / DSM 1100 / LMG 10767 / O) TaxID=760192 RepID=F4KW81_HALH1|nr:hypothetical protein [Haliscomenobacter hydrossis]AEE49269.1 PKD domain containing protein [Haliscomenobacter hydrossis DSM 1100]
MKKTTTRLLMLSLCLLLSQLLWSQNPGVKSNNGKPITISQALNTNKTGNKTVTLRASGGDKFRWNTGASTQAIEVPFDSRERYTVDVEEKDGRRTSLTTPLSPALFQRKVTKPGSAQLSAPDPQPGCPTSSLTGSYSRICAGTTLQLSANGGTSYLWSTGQTSSSIQVTPTENISYTVTITFSDPEESLFCQDIKSTGLIEVIEQPTAVINGGGGNLCGGGVAVLTAGGGDTYLWNTGATSASITVAPASTSLYSVTATKAGLCTDDASTTVNVTPFNPSVSGLSTVCLGYGAQLSASGGTSYLWSNGFQSSSINVGPTSPGTYAYSVTITNGSCSAVRSHTLTVNPSPSASISGPAGACYNGSIALNASGGGTFSWSTGASTASINVAALQNTQSFTVTVSNSYGCKRSESKTVTVYAPPSLDGPLSVCAGQAANLSVTGGSSYSWNTGETTASISPYPSSTSIYRVTVSDPNACTYVLSKTVSVSNLPDARISGPNTTCAGQNVSLTAFGGSSYLWSTGANTATINVSPGSTTTYTVTVSSSGGCVGSASQVISVHPLPLGNIAGASSVCPGQSTTLSASGGSTYAWNTGASSAAIEVSPTQNTTYTVSITNAQGCTLVKSHSVAVNITGSASNDGPLTCTKTTATLLGTSSAQGASYRWKNASGVEIATTPGTTVTTVGVYTLEITAAGGCTYTTATEVVQDLQIPQVSANSSGMLTCVQSSINLLGTSSASPASYEWRNGSGILIANTLNASTTQTGTYTLKVTAANGCSNTAGTTVTADLATPQVSVQHDGSLTCAKPSAILSAGSSSSGLQYTWKDAAGNPLGTGSSIQVTNSGTYWLEAKGANGCIVSQSIALTQSGTLPTVNVSLITSGCHFTLQGSSTTAGVSYSWTNQNGRVVATTPSFTTNQASIYTLKVSTASGCSKQASINAGNSETTVSMSIGGVSQGYLTYHKTNLTCTKNSVVLSASSADVIDSYLWKSPSGAYLSYSSNLTVTQAGTYLLQAGTENGCPQIHEVLVERINTMPAAQISGDSTVCRYASTNLSIFVSGGTYQWSNGSSSFSINTGSVANDVSFAVTVTLGSCQKIYPRTVRVEGQAPSGTGTAGPTQPCTHIPVTYSASGGSQYKWSSGETTSTVSVPNGFTSTSWVNYWVDISDQYGCSTRRSFTVKPKISPVVTVSGVPTAPFCEQALINLTATGGGTYLWSSGETTANLQKTLSASSSLNVKVTAANGCAITKPINIEVVPRPIPQILGGDIACAGGSTTLSATGGSTYLWSNNATTSSIALTQPTTTQAYSVTVSTQPGCSGVAQKTVIVPAALSLNYTLANLEDCTANNASVQPIVTGGQGNISLSIARYGELYFSPSLNGLRSGTYVLKAEDNQQCIALKEVVIEENQPAPAIDLPDVEVCAGATASLSINNAAAYTTFLWSNGATTSSITVSPTTITTYTVTATASNGCQATDEVVLRVNPMLTASAGGGGTFCLPFGSSANATLFASVNGGTAPYTYQWYSGQTTASISVSTPASAGFGVVVSDSKGCTASASASVIVIPLPQAQITGGEVNCYGLSTTLTATGGQTYLWSTGATTTSIAINQPTQTATYTVTVTNGGVCTSVAQKIVLVPEVLSVSYTPANDDDCILNNVIILPTSNAQGDVHYQLALQGSTDFSDDLQGKGSGNYTLKATDENGCEAILLFTINEVQLFLTLNYELDNPDDCIKGNAQLHVNAQNGHGPVEIRINPNGNPDTIFTVASGTYEVFAIDSLGCRDTLEVVVDERLPYDLRAYQRNTEDCDPNNTAIAVYGQSARGALSFQLDDGVPQTDSLFSNVTPGVHDLYFIDSTGCRDSFYVNVANEAQIPVGSQGVSHCDTADASAVIYLQPSNATVQYQYSLDAGQSWQNEYTFDNLAPGQYFPAVKKLPAGCIIMGDTLVISDTCRAYALAGFTKDTVMITQPDQLVIFPWLIETPSWMQDDFNLKVVLQGTGEPHFVEFNPDGTNANLRSERLFAQRQYLNGFNGPDRDSTALASTARLFNYPQEYIFSLQSVTPTKLKIDPKRKDLRVIVTFDPDGYTEEEIIICAGESTTLNAGLGSCFIWDDGSTENPRTVSPTEDTEYSVTVLDDKLRATLKRYKVKVINPVVKIVPSELEKRLCNATPITLTAQVSGVPDLAQVQYLWSTGETTSSITVPTTKPINPAIRSVTVSYIVNTNKTCSATTEIDVENLVTAEEENICYNISAELEEQGFVVYACKVIEEIPITTPELRSVDPVSDYSQFDVSIQNIVIPLRPRLTKIINMLRAKGYNANGYITDADDICDNSQFEQVESVFEQDIEDHDVWVHVVKCDEDGNGFVFVRANEEFINIQDVMTNLLYDEQIEMETYPLRQFVLAGYGTEGLDNIIAYVPADLVIGLDQEIVLDMIKRNFIGGGARFLPNGTLTVRSINDQSVADFRLFHMGRARANDPIQSISKDGYSINWYFNGTDISVQNHGINLIELGNRVSEGENSIRVVIQNSQGQIQDLSLSLFYSPPPPIAQAGTLRIEATVNGRLKGIYTPTERIGDPQRGDNPLHYDDDISVRIGVSTPTSAFVPIFDGVLNFTELTAQNGNPLVFKLKKETPASQRRIVASQGPESASFFLYIEEPKNIPNKPKGTLQSDFLAGPTKFDKSIKGDTKAKIQAKYQEALAIILKHAPDFYNFFSNNVSLELEVTKDGRGGRAGHTVPTFTTAQDFPFLRLDKPVTSTETQADGTSKVILTDATLVSLLNSSERDELSKASNLRRITEKAEDIINKIAATNANEAATIRQHILAGTLTPQHMETSSYDVSANDLSRFGYYSKFKISIDYSDNRSVCEFARTLLHELAHVRFKNLDPIAALKWEKISNAASKLGSTVIVGEDNATNRSMGLCSEGHGHQRGNPENAYVCNAENLIPETNCK